MKRRITGLFSVAGREINKIAHDVDLIAILLIGPLFYSFLYSTFYMRKTETDIPIAVFDKDRSAVSRQFIRDLDAHQLLKVNEELKDLPEIKDRIYSGKDQGIVYIPENFSSSLKSRRQANIKLYLNTERFLPSNDMNKAVNEVVLRYADKARVQAMETKGYSIKQAEQISEPLEDHITFLFNPSNTYGDFLLPGLFIILLQQTLFIGLSESIASEREYNTLLHWFKKADKSISSALAGKSIFYLVLYMAYAAFYFIVEFSIFKVPFRGSYTLVFLLTSIFLISVFSMSIFLASFFKKKILALQIIAFTSYPLFFLTGYSWPQSAMPSAVRWFAQLIPATPYLHAYQRVTQMGAVFNDVSPEFIQLLILTFIGITASYFRMKFLFYKTAGSEDLQNTA